MHWFWANNLRCVGKKIENWPVHQYNFYKVTQFFLIGLSSQSLIRNIWAKRCKNTFTFIFSVRNCMPRLMRSCSVKIKKKEEKTFTYNVVSYAFLGGFLHYPFDPKRIFFAAQNDSPEITMWKPKRK